MTILDATSFRTSLIAFIADEVAIGDDVVEPETDLLLTGLVDSLGVVLIVDWIESRLGVTIDPADVVLEHFVSVEAMVQYLAARDAIAAPGQ